MFSCFNDTFVFFFFYLRQTIWKQTLVRRLSVCRWWLCHFSFGLARSRNEKVAETLNHFHDLFVSLSFFFLPCNTVNGLQFCGALLTPKRFPMASNSPTESKTTLGLNVLPKDTSTNWDFFFFLQDSTGDNLKDSRETFYLKPSCNWDYWTKLTSFRCYQK